VIALEQWYSTYCGLIASDVVFENMVLRGILLPKRFQVAGGWRELHNEELHGLYSSPSIIRINKSIWMRWAGHVARMEAKRNVYRLLFDSQREREQYEDQDVGGWIMIR
jgi:hypothetical protein